MDGGRIGLKEKEDYQKILIDAPCSGERHMLRNPSLLKKWSPARSKNLSQRQYTLLASGWAALTRGGRLVYSTCSISNLENDAVISRLVKKKGDAVQIVKQDWFFGEATQWGWQILPDQDEGWGPLYFSILAKAS